MKAIQIDKYAKGIRTVLRDISVPEIGPDEVLVQVNATAVNPLELLILTGSVKLIQDYSMPLTLGNECAGIVDKIGKMSRAFRLATRFIPGFHCRKSGRLQNMLRLARRHLPLCPPAMILPQRRQSP